VQLLLIEHQAPVHRGSYENNQDKTGRIHYHIYFDASYDDLFTSSLRSRYANFYNFRTLSVVRALSKMQNVVPNAGKKCFETRQKLQYMWIAYKMNCDI